MEEENQRVIRIKDDIYNLKRGFVRYNKKSWWATRGHSILIRVILKVLRENYEKWGFDRGGGWVRSRKVCEEVAKQYKEYIDDVIKKINEGKIPLENLDKDIKKELRRIMLNQKKQYQKLRGNKNSGLRKHYEPFNKPETIEDYKVNPQYSPIHYRTHTVVKRVLFRAFFPKYINTKNVVTMLDSPPIHLRKGRMNYYVSDVISLTLLGRMAIGKIPIQDLKSRRKSKDDKGGIEK